MASLALGAVGAYFGSFFGPWGTKIGWMIGSYIGGLIDAEDTEGPRLEDKSMQTASYGSSIPIWWGTYPLIGTVTDQLPVVEIPEENDSKGGLGPSNTTYRYYGTFAVKFGKGECLGARRIWFNGELFMDLRATNTGPAFDVSLLGAGVNDVTADYVMSPVPNVRVYRGTLDQMPDPALQTHFGVGHVSAYRGDTYIVFDTIPLDRYGNRIPLEVKAEMIKSGSTFVPDPIDLNLGGYGMERDPLTGYLWITNDYIDGIAQHGVMVVDPVTGERIATIIIPTADLGGGGVGSAITYVPPRFEMWVGGGGRIFRFHCTIMQYMGYIVVTSASILKCLEDSNLVIACGNGGSAVDVTSLTVVPGTSFPGRTWFLTDIPGQFLFILGKDVDNVNMLQPIEIRDGMSGLLISTEYIPAPSSGGVNGPRAAPYDKVRGVIFYVPYWSAVKAYTFHVLSGLVTEFDFSDEDITADYHTFYHKKLDRYIVTGISSKVGGSAVAPHIRLHLINAGSLEYQEGFLYDPELAPAGQVIDAIESTEYVYGINKYSSFVGNPRLSRMFLVPRMNMGAAVLSDIVEELCLMTPLQPGEFDVSQLDDVVDGYAITRTMPVRDAIAHLMKVYYFDAVESAGVGKFVKRGGSVAMVLDTADMPNENRPGELIKIIREPTYELPWQVNALFIDINKDYERGSAYARRLIPTSSSEVTMDLAIVMDGDKGQQVAACNLYNAYAQRTRYSWPGGRRHTRLEPTDIVQFEKDGVLHTARITKKDDSQQGRIEFEGVAEDQTIYTRTGIGGTTGYVPQTIRIGTSNTILTFLDIPILRDTDNDAGVYLVPSSATIPWAGQTTHRSVDGGLSYTPVASTTVSNVLGGLATLLGDFQSGYIYDELNQFTVRLRPGMALSSKTRANVDAGANTAAVGLPGRWEIIRFRNAVLVSVNTYVVSGLLRGLEGTEQFMSQHQVGDMFVLASETSWLRVQSDIGLTRLWKGVSFGSMLNSAAAIEFTNTGAGLMPKAPCRLGGGRSTNGTITINWTRRARVNDRWRDTIDVPLDEATESYQIKLYDGPLYDTVVRTETVSLPTYTYLDTDQNTDLGALAAPAYVEVRQISAAVGPGFALRGTV